MERSPSGSPADARKISAPNVVFLVIDTARAKSVSPDTMPTLFELAADGTRFDHAFATAPWTLPSHASMFTGTHASTHGAHGRTPYLSADWRSVAECFSDAGYETVAVSNNTWITEEFGFARGFDSFRRAWQVYQDDVDIGAVVRSDHLRAKLAAARTCVSAGTTGRTVANILLSELRLARGDKGATDTTEWIEAWLSRRVDDRPFFLFANYIEPHIPYRPPREHAERYLPGDIGYEEAMAIRQDPRAFDVELYELADRDFAALRGLYRGELRYIDTHIARIRRALEASGAREETIVVVCSDHGENIGEHDLFGHQYNLYDTVIHVPLVIAGGPFDDGGVRDDLVGLHDLPTTMLAAAGIEDSTFAAQAEGYDLLEPVGDREAIVSEYIAPQPSPAQLVERFGSIPQRVWAYDRTLRSVRTKRYHYLRGDDGWRVLFEVDTDPEEAHPVDDGARIDRYDRLLEIVGQRDEGEMQKASIIPTATRDHLAKLGYL